MISVLMPVYNAGEYLYKSIGSIQKQTVQDFEIIAVDDGSTDNSLEILRDLQNKDSRIKIFTREERGYAVTMNEAIDRAAGEYILNVDPDDWLEPNMFERMLEEFDDDTDFVKCGFVFELKDNEQVPYLYADEPVEFCPRKLPPDLKMRFFSSQIAIWTCLIRRSFVNKHGIRLHETPGAAYQDTAFIFQINACAEKVRVIPDLLYHYNKTNEGASTKSTNHPLAPSVEYNWMADWCIDHPKIGMYVRSVLCKSRYGSYMWNLQRIKQEDRAAFARAMQKDFIDDWNWIDVRMFSKDEFDLYLIAKNSPEELIEVFRKAMMNIRKHRVTDK